jgi:hypothetical protein
MKLQTVRTNEEKIKRHTPPTRFSQPENPVRTGKRTSDIGYQDAKLDIETGKRGNQEEM